MIRCLLDMNISPRWAKLLQTAGYAVKHWSEVGKFDASDREIMDYARQNGCVVVTADLDFSAMLAATNDSSPSVVQLRGDDLSPEKIGRAVLSGLAQCEAELVAGALVTIDGDRNRIRLLPFNDER